MSLDTSQIYYIQARAWALKGYFGGTHSWTTFFSNEHNAWCVVEVTDKETLMCQDGIILYEKVISNDDTVRAPYISTRSYNAEWFGSKPSIIDSCPTVSYDAILNACKDYPYSEFRLLDLNCNTFSSYLYWKLNLDLKQPLRSVGFKNKKYWDKICLR
jgi:hypothetical protein